MGNCCYNSGLGPVINPGPIENEYHEKTRNLSVATAAEDNLGKNLKLAKIINATKNHIQSRRINPYKKRLKKPIYKLFFGKSCEKSPKSVTI